MLITLNIRGWIEDNFQTNTHQREFLAGLDESFVVALAEQTARAIRHRWPIIFDPAQPQTDLRSDKWVRSRATDEADTRPTGTRSTYNGKLVIETGY